MPTIRRDLVTILGLALAGCAQVGPELPHARPPSSAVGIEDLPSIHQSINGGLAPRDPDSRLVAHQPTPEAAPTPMSEPFEADPMPGQADTPAAMPDVVEGGEPVPITQAPAPAFAPDPIFNEHPDAVPSVDLPPRPTEPAFGEFDNSTERSDPGAEPPAPSPPVEPFDDDPIFGASPNAVPSADLPPLPEAFGAAPNAGPPPGLPPLPESPPEVAPTIPPADPGSDPLGMSSGPATIADPMPSASMVPPRAASADPDPIFGTHPNAVPRAEPPGMTEPLAPLPATVPSVPAPEPIAPADPAVREVSDSTAMRSRVEAASTLNRAGEVAAWVGNDVITLRELSNAVAEHLKQAPPGAVPTNEERNVIASAALGTLIDRAMILQEARRTLKSPGQWDKFKQYVDKIWLDEEMPRILKKESAANQYELKIKLEKEGRSLEQMHAEYRNGRMAREFMMMKLEPKLRVGLPEMRDYYNAHLDEFDQAAQVTWREIVVSAAKSPSHAEARSKAEGLLERLRLGDDFAKVAQTESDGPTRLEGGLWKTSPGGYAVASVNQALETLPQGEFSPIIEGPSGFHIVRVEGRRDAGPARFDEVQDQIRETIGERKYQNAVQAYLDEMRERTLITTIFDGTQSAPRQAAR